MATSETKLPSTSDATLYLLNWNVGLNKTDKGKSAIRNMIVSKVVESVQKSVELEHVIFLQEALSKKSTESKLAVKEFYHDGRVTGTSCHRSGLSTPSSSLLTSSDEFTLTNYLHPDPMIRDLDERTFARIIHLERRTEKHVGKASLIVVSFHMIKKIKDDKKKETIKRFFEKMCNIANEKKTTVLVGGDFNLEISKWAVDVEKTYYDKVVVSDYRPSPRRKGCVIDTFAIVYPENIDDRMKHQVKSVVPVYPFPLSGYVCDFKVDDALVDYPDESDVQYKIIKYNKQELDTLGKLLGKPLPIKGDTYTDDAIVPALTRRQIQEEDISPVEKTNGTDSGDAVVPQPAPMSTLVSTKTTAKLPHSGGTATGDATVPPVLALKQVQQRKLHVSAKPFEDRPPAKLTSTPEEVPEQEITPIQGDSPFGKSDKLLGNGAKCTESDDAIVPLDTLASTPGQVPQGEISPEQASLPPEMTAKLTSIEDTSRDDVPVIVSSDTVASTPGQVPQGVILPEQRIGAKASLQPMKLPTEPTPLWSADLYYDVLNHDPLLAKLKVKFRMIKIEQSPSKPQPEQSTPTKPAKEVRRRNLGTIIDNV